LLTRKKIGPTLDAERDRSLGDSSNEDHLNSRRPRIQIAYVDRLEVEYRKLLELRERARKAEVAAALRK
jgi:hypothetical protein